MPKYARVVIDCRGVLKTFVWLSFQDDKSISLGFSDRAFTLPGLREEVEIDGAVHTTTVDFEGMHGLKAVTNPHFTFHPPGYVHVRANAQSELFAGLLMIDFIVERDGLFPWIRFTSSPVRDLSDFKQGRSGGQGAALIRLIVPSDDLSVELAVDFVKPSTSVDASRFTTDLPWHGRVLRLSASHRPGQPGTVGWLHLH